MNTEIQKNNPLGTEPINSLLAKFAIPSIIAMLVSALFRRSQTNLDRIECHRLIGFFIYFFWHLITPFLALEVHGCPTWQPRLCLTLFLVAQFLIKF